MAQRTAQQLELPISLAEGLTLRETLAQIQKELAQLQEDAELGANAIARLDRETHELHQERDAARAEVQSLQSQLQAPRLLRNLQSDRSITTPATLPARLAQELRKLLALAHPDKWSAGQDAAALVYELTVGLNGIRDRLGEGACP